MDILILNSSEFNRRGIFLKIPENKRVDLCFLRLKQNLGKPF